MELTTNVLIEVFDDRVVISNPGGLPGGLKPADFGTKSVVRNQLIASLLHRIDFIEKVGTGISRIRDAVRENGKSTVAFSYDAFFTVTYYRGRPESDEGLNGGLSETSEKNALKMSEKTDNVGENTLKMSEEIVALIRRNPFITISELSQETNVATRTVERNIKKLQMDGRLNRVGPDKGGHWELVEQDGE